LVPEEGSLLRSFRKTTRYEIRRSEQQGTEVRLASDGADIEGFLRLYVDMAKSKGFNPDPASHVREVLHWILLDEHRGALLMAAKNGTLLGGTLVMRGGKRCWYVLGATRKGEASVVGHLLQWRAIQWAKKQGCEEYDFGGYREGINSGPALFKRGFCDNVVHFVPIHRYEIDRRLCKIVGLFSGIRSLLASMSNRLRSS
jgi:lipid II:glycine glycyltransferase (peptidoglycan interpeptide bridge formation enzyme)